MEAHAQNRCRWMHHLSHDYAFLMQRAEFHFAACRYAQAREDYARASLLAPQQPQPHVGLGLVALHAGDLNEAWAAFEAARRLDKASATACCGLAVVHHCRGENTQALPMYCRCLELDPDNLTALLGLLELSVEQGRFDPVKRFLQQYAVRHPHDVAIMLSLTAVFLHEEQFAAARQVLFDILVLDPRNAAASALLEELDHVQLTEELERARQMYLMPYC